MTQSHDILIVGAGIYGATAALTLNERGHRVAILDQGQIPHPLAASTDISKVVRLAYGDDVTYTALMEQAMPGWRAWNDLLGDTLYHETGTTMFTREPMSAGGYEYESYTLLTARGHTLERLDAQAIQSRFPAWHESYVDGFFHAEGGFVESGRLVSALIERAKAQGVTAIEGQTVAEFVQSGNTITGVITESGDQFNADMVIVAAGAWSMLLVPELAPMMKATGHPVFHLQPDNAELFTPPDFVVFTADVANTGWYGFPVHPHEGVIKIANHGVGKVLNPAKDERIVTGDDKTNLRAMLKTTFPALTTASIVYTRRCLYCDTLDEHFLIDQHPTLKGLTLATGGSGHGMKFAPILGDLIADAVEGNQNTALDKFRWRELSPDTIGEESARYHGD